ncbi:hypothetical protein K9M06_02480 [Candidatus Bipolaricaulota bacterium]|nr:hypothetical protein [Candidatus Bipolaricaulota bacterium]
MKKTLVSLLVISALVSLPVVLMASDNLPEGAPPNSVKPEGGRCPGNYSKITYNMGFISMELCVPHGSDVGPTPPDDGGTPPPPPDDNDNPPPPPDNGQHSEEGNPPALGSPPSVPENPGGQSKPPRGEQDRALNEKPDNMDYNTLGAVRRNNLYFYYQGRYTQQASVYQGRWLPVYVKLPRGGNLRVRERYYRSGRVRNYNWGYRPSGWTKFWFYADTRGWHALISNTNGSWGNWIWVYVN